MFFLESLEDLKLYRYDSALVHVWKEYVQTFLQNAIADFALLIALVFAEDLQSNIDEPHFVFARIAHELSEAVVEHDEIFVCVFLICKLRPVKAFIDSEEVSQLVR